MTVVALAAGIVVGLALARWVWPRVAAWWAPDPPPPPPPFDGTLRCATPGCHVPLGHTSNPRTVAWCETCRPTTAELSDPAG